MSSLRRWSFPAFAVAHARSAGAAGAGLLDHAEQLHRHVRAGVAGPGAAHRRQRAHVVRPGGIRRHRRLHRRVPGHQGRHLAVADAAHRRGAGGGRGACRRRRHASHVGPLPAAGHDRLGAGAELHHGQHGVARQVRRPARHPVAAAVRHGTRHRPRPARPDLAVRAARRAGHHAPARFAAGPRDPLAEERIDDGRGDGHLDLPLQAHRLRARRGAGGRVGLAVRALPAHGQSDAVLDRQGHRVPVHGRARRGGPRLGCLSRRRRREDRRRPASGAAAQADRHQRQLRDHRLRHRAGGGAEVRAGRAMDFRRPLAAGAEARARLGRRAGAAGAATSRPPANYCSTWPPCARSSAAWSR